ncbi:MAG: HPr family phosphocarrier protein [Planctomycetes bacterium]|nr:HPr family phosphocarrier protein [Planctomycetota bacterium]
MSNTVSETVTLTNRYGLHARPAALFVELCNRFSSEVEVCKDGMQVNGKNILDIMMLGAEPGSNLTLNANGSDAEEAVKQLVELVKSNFGET